MNKKTVKDIDVKGKKVLVRCDFNVPLDENGRITDNTRITAALPTIKYLMDRGAKVVLCSHLGRPKGEVNEKYSLKPVAEELTDLLSTDVKFANDVTGERENIFLNLSFKPSQFVGIYFLLQITNGEEQREVTQIGMPLKWRILY